MFIFLIGSISATDIGLAKNSESAILIEASTGKILFEKEKDKKMAPASMTKIMTMLLAMEAIENGKLNLEDEVLISKRAQSMGGTQIYVEAGSNVKVHDLLKGIGIASANDAAVAIAEKIGGTVENFVNMMNERARDLGCKNTTFKNPHGLDEDGHLTTAYDMALMARELVKHELAIKISSTFDEYINVSGENHWLVNTNKLIKFYKGIDGLKTGYTDKAGYCLTATMNKNNMRLISVVMKSNTKDNRSSDTIGMMEYGYSMYGSETILNKKEYSGVINIKGSENRNYKYYLENDIKIIVDKDRIQQINKEYRGKDAVTDVISFAFEEVDDVEYDNIRFLGEIYICYDRCVEQASEYGHSIKREFCYLAVHGLLHLLGYDHMEKEDEIKMFSLQNEILKEYGVNR